MKKRKVQTWMDPQPLIIPDGVVPDPNTTVKKTRIRIKPNDGNIIKTINTFRKNFINCLFVKVY